MKIALIIGINHYLYGGDLYGCVNDAYSVKGILERNFDGSVNSTAIVDRLKFKGST
jgi:hypothetical protein